MARKNIMSSSHAFEKEIVDPIYSKNTYLYNRKVGNKEFHWTAIPSIEQTDDTLNNIPRILNFRQMLNNSYYDMRNSKLILTFKLTDSAKADLAVNAKVGLSSDTFIKNGRLAFGTQDINNHGSKDALHRPAHIEKLLTYEPNYAKAISGHEHFYPDTGMIGGVSRVPFVHKAALVQLDTDGAIGMIAKGGVTNEDGTISMADIDNPTLILNNFISVGYDENTTANNTTAGFPTVAASLIDIARSDRPDGNTVFRTDYNETFNQGFYNRERRTTESNVTTVTIPLKYYFKVLNAFPDAVTGFNLDLRIQLPTDAEMLMSSSNVAAGAKFIISRAELRIPSYTPNEIVQNEMINRLKIGDISIRKYVDWDYQVSQDLDAGAVRTNVTFPSKFDRRPLGFLFGFQFNGDVDSQNGNCHRYFDPEVVSAQISVGGTQIGANYLVGNAGFNDEQAYFEELMKLADIVNTSDGVVLDWDAFHYHKFFCPFDVRDQLSEEIITDIMIKSVPVTFSAVHGPISTAVGTAGISGYLPGGTYKINMFALVERAIEVRMTSSGMTVVPNVIA